MGVNTTVLSILVAPEKASLKRLAWAYGCAKKGSDEEKRLEGILIERAVDRYNGVKDPTER